MSPYSAPLNEGWAYEEGGGGVWQYRGKRYNNKKKIFFNGRVIRLSNVDVKGLDVLYKSIGTILNIIFIFSIIFELKSPVTGK
jgi:hypothetical protein